MEGPPTNQAAATSVFPPSVLNHTASITYRTPTPLQRPHFLRGWVCTAKTEPQNPILAYSLQAQTHSGNRDASIFSVAQEVTTPPPASPSAATKKPLPLSPSRCRPPNLWPLPSHSHPRGVTLLGSVLHRGRTELHFFTVGLKLGNGALV